MLECGWPRLRILYRDCLFASLDLFEMSLNGIKNKHSGTADVCEMQLCINAKEINCSHTIKNVLKRGSITKKRSCLAKISNSLRLSSLIVFASLT